MKFYILVLALLVTASSYAEEASENKNPLAGLFNINSDDVCAKYETQSAEAVKWNDKSIPAKQVCQDTITCADAYEEYTEAGKTQKDDAKDLQDDINELREKIQEAETARAEGLNNIASDIADADQVLQATTEEIQDEYIKHTEATQKEVDALEANSKAKATERTKLLTSSRNQLERNAQQALKSSYEKCNADAKAFYQKLVADNKAIANAGNRGKIKQVAKSNKKLKEEAQAEYNTCITNATTAMNNQKATAEEEMSDQLTKLTNELDAINKEWATIVQQTNPQKLAQFEQKRKTAENVRNQTIQKKERERQTLTQSTDQKVKLLNQQIAAKEAQLVTIKDKRSSGSSEKEKREAAREAKAEKRAAKEGGSDLEDSDLVDSLQNARAACCDLGQPAGKRLVALFPQVAKKSNQKTPNESLCGDKRVQSGSGKSKTLK